MFVECGDELLVFESLLFEHTARRAVIAIEVDQHGFTGALGSFHGLGEVLGPFDLLTGLLTGGLGLFCLHSRCKNRGTEQQERHWVDEGIAGLHRNGSGVTE